MMNISDTTTITEASYESSSSDMMNVDPVQLVYSIVQAIEDDTDSDSDKEEEEEVSRQQKKQPRAETKEFLQTLHEYLDCRRQMNTKYLKVDELETLANFDLVTDSGGIELLQLEQQPANNKLRISNPNVRNHGPSLGFKPEYQQQSIHGQAVRTLNELYEAAEVTFPVYQRLIHSLVDGVRRRSPADHGKSRTDDDIKVTFASLKGKDRAQEKARDDYSKRIPDPGVSWLFDIVRGSISFASADQMIAALQALQEDPSIHIVKAKNRFRNPGLSGYRDWNIHIRIQVTKAIDDDDNDNDTTTTRNFHHICEIQMHHEALEVLDKELHSHQHYEFFRSYFAGATTSLQGRLDDLKLIDEGFSLPGGIDDDAFLDALLEGKSNEEAPAAAEEEEEANDNDDEESQELSKAESRLVRLGRLFRLHLNELDLALCIYGKLLSIQLEQYGDNRHVQIGYTYDRIGNALVKQGKLDEAMILHRNAYEIKKAALGELDPSMGESFKCLAAVLEKKGKLKEALEYSQKAVNLYKHIKGEESYEVAFIYGGMAAIFRKQNKMEEALELYEKAVEIDILQNGEDCTSVAYVYNGMAWIHKHQGNLDEALRLFELSRDISKRMYGDQHSSLCFTYNGIADILKRQDKLEEALEVYQKSLSITERRSGRDHPAVFFVYTKMIKILKKLGRADEALRVTQLLQTRDSKRNLKSMQRESMRNSISMQRESSKSTIQ